MQISQNGPDVIITLRVQANAHKCQIIGWESGFLKVKITAVREKGRANEALREFLSDTLELAKSKIEILSGFTSSIKRVKLLATTKENIVLKIKSLTEL